MGILIGIDGGGTHSTAIAVYPDGRAAAVAYGDGLNFHNVGISVARKRLEAMVRTLRDACDREQIEGICVGMSALDGPADAETFRLFAQGALAEVHLDLQSDVYVALSGFTLGGSGVMVICGTGSMLLMKDEEGCQHVSGGWGYLLRDAGSGYTLAKEALLAVIDETDGLGEKTALTDDALSYFGVDTVREIIDVIYAPEFTPDKLAGFSRCVLAKAQSGEPIAQEILMRNMDQLAMQTACLMKRASQVTNVGLYGGIFEHSRQARTFFEHSIRKYHPQACVSQLDCPPELGAVIHLLSQRTKVTEGMVERMKATYKEICNEHDARRIWQG